MMYSLFMGQLYFCLRRGCPRVLKFCRQPSLTKTIIMHMEKYFGYPLYPPPWYIGSKVYFSTGRECPWGLKFCMRPSKRIFHKFLFILYSQSLGVYILQKYEFYSPVIIKATINFPLLKTFRAPSARNFHLLSLNSRADPSHNCFLL